jgi:hypothetical protein
MKHVQNLVRDLVERRLWPVAVLLVVAAIAVPVYLGRSSSSDAEGDVSVPAATAQMGAKASKAAVTLEDSSAEGGSGGSVRNPFKQQHVAKAAGAGAGNGSTSAPGGDTSPSAAPGSGSSGGTTPSGSGGDSGGSGGSDTSGGADKSGSTDKPDPDISHVTLRFGKSETALKTLKDVARLSPLPSVNDPFFVFTGVLEDGKTAVFLLSSEVKATGDGKCKPRAANCETIEITQGSTEFFDLTVDGKPVQYQLDVVRVSRGKAASATAGAAALQRHSKAGAAMLRNAHVRGSSAFQGSGAYRWLPDKGVLVRAPEHSKARASANGAAAASAADVDATLPGLPVWHWRSGA